MSMFRKVLLTIGLLLIAQAALFAQGTIKGNVTDAKTGETLMMVTVAVKQNGQLITGAQTDFDGLYTIKSVPVGKYDIEVSYVGYTKHVRSGVEVKASGFTVVNVALQQAMDVLDAVEVVAEKVPIIEIGEAASGSRISSDDIAKMPGQSVDAIVAAVGGVGYSDGGTGTARGEDGMVTMQGGVRRRTSVNVPKEAIAEIQVILGGTPASIGEAIGGTQIITLKPPSSQFNGVFKYEAFADYRLYNSLTAYVSGPMIKTKKALEGGGVQENVLAGFRFTGQATYYPWGAYRARGYDYKVVNDEKVMELEQNPLVYDPVNKTINYAGEYLRESDFVSIKRPTSKYYASPDRVANFRTYSIGTQLALAFRFSEYTTLELTGEYAFSKAASAAIDALNMTRAANGVDENNQFSITLDFTQRFPDEAAPAGSTDPEAKSSKLISNVMWNLNGRFERTNAMTYNESFGKGVDNVLKYGHVGQYFTEKTRSYQPGAFDYNGIHYDNAMIQNGWADFNDIDKFIPSQYNPILANYTLQLKGIDELKPYLSNFDMLQAYKGLINGGSLSSIYGIFSNVGAQSTGYAYSQNNFYYGSIKAAATIAGKHDVELGFQYDQYTSAYYALSAYSLWTIMRQTANAHITQLDFDHPIVHEEDGTLYVDYDRLVSAEGQTTFDASLRQALGASANDWLDVDRYDPDWYVNAAKSMGLNNVLEMFSSTDLFNSHNSVVSYYGYDHTGAKYNGSNWSLDDFFDPVAKGHANFQYRPVFSPIYMAGYIQDKFFFQDLIFNVGVRVDYFDGNQYVLKDPYLLYESYTVGDLRKNTDIDINTGFDGRQFANAAQDDWVVYVDDAGATTPTIRGYRSGSTWYDANGVEVSTPAAIAGESGKPTPFRTQGENGGQHIATLGNSSGNKVSSSAFEDYKPQIVVMPRIAFSFPVGETSQFKASYDIIARRPSSGWQADYFSYLYMNQITSINNPNLKPERNTNYELGFQQALDKKTAVGITAYYKETRDLIQLVQYVGADPNQNYYSYDNIDFKTTKGFTFTFDLRSTDRIRINANYTLQYAEGTGLNSTTMSELIKEGYTTLKMLNPISDDRRHEFKANIDYRFGNKDGWHYTTRKKNKDGVDEKVERYPLQNLGFNVMAIAQSGRPYTRAFSIRQNTIVGSYRGARLPWGFYFDAVADKTWPITMKTKSGKVKNSFVKASVTVKNVFDTRNIINVFSVTGSPTDNGYLNDPETQSIINAYLDPQSFRDMYSISMYNGTWNWCSPRTIRLTLTYGF